MTEANDTGAAPGLIEAAAERYFPEGGPQLLELELFADMGARLREFAAQRGLSEADAMRLALAAGLAFLSDEAALRAAEGAAGQSAEDLERLLARHVALEADYAVMKHRLWLALQDNQVMALRDGTLAKSVQGLQALVKKLSGDLAALEREAAEWRARPAAPMPAQLEPAVRAGWLFRLRAWLRGGPRGPAGER